MINFHCPDIYHGLPVYIELMNIALDHPEVFNDNVRIGSVYGSFPGMIWNGGVYLPGFVSLEVIKNYLYCYQELNIPIKFTMTNSLVTKEDCYDRYCNKILELGESENNEVAVTSPILEEYIRAKYPKYKICKSIIATAEDEDYNAALDKYDNIVLPRRFGKNFDKLKTIDPDKRNRVQILCTDVCPIDCPRLYSHYQEYAKAALFETTLNEYCISIKPEDQCIGDMVYLDQQITFEELPPYLDLGFTEFKISGRTNNIKISEHIVRYFIKPKYQLEILTHLILKYNPNVINNSNFQKVVEQEREKYNV